MLENCTCPLNLQYKLEYSRLWLFYGWKIKDLTSGCTGTALTLSLYPYWVHDYLLLYTAVLSIFSFCNQRSIGKQSGGNDREHWVRFAMDHVESFTLGSIMLSLKGHEGFPQEWLVSCNSPESVCTWQKPSSHCVREWRWMNPGWCVVYVGRLFGSNSQRVEELALIHWKNK